MYRPLKTALPLSMANLSYGMPLAGEELKRAESRGEILPKPEKQSSFSDDVRWDEKALKWMDPEERKSSREITSTPEHSSVPDHSSAQDHSPIHLVSPYTTPEKKSSYSDSSPQQDPQYIELAEMGGSKGSSTRPSGTEGDGEAADLDEEEDPESQYFAVPGGPGVIVHEVEEADDPGAFFHPATKEPQRVVWIPKDDLGLGAEQNSANISMGLRSSTRAAVMNKKVSILALDQCADFAGQGEDLCAAAAVVVLYVELGSEGIIDCICICAWFKSTIVVWGRNADMTQISDDVLGGHHAGCISRDCCQLLSLLIVAPIMSGKPAAVEGMTSIMTRRIPACRRDEGYATALGRTNTQASWSSWASRPSPSPSSAPSPTSISSSSHTSQNTTRLASWAILS